MFLDSVAFNKLDDKGKEKYFLEECAYTHVRKLPDGKWIGIMPLMFTTAIAVDIDFVGLKYRFCFDDKKLLYQAFISMQSIEDIPIGWIACRPAERLPQPCFFAKDGEVLRWGISFKPKDYFPA